MYGSPLVSVLITSYNREKYIEEAIQSVLSQEYTNFELIIVDDCSTDNTLKLATSYANAIAGTAIDLTDGVGANHKLSKGTMLCRTKFPVIVKSGSETIAISWVVSVG